MAIVYLVTPDAAFAEHACRDPGRADAWYVLRSVPSRQLAVPCGERLMLALDLFGDQRDATDRLRELRAATDRDVRLATIVRVDDAPIVHTVARVNGVFAETMIRGGHVGHLLAALANDPFWTPVSAIEYGVLCEWLPRRTRGCYAIPPVHKSRRNVATGRISTPSDVTRRLDSRQTSIRRRIPGWSSARERSPRRSWSLVPAEALTSIATSISPRARTKSTSMPLARRQYARSQSRERYSRNALSSWWM